MTFFPTLGRERRVILLTQLFVMLPMMAKSDVCGIPVDRVDDVVQWRIYWFGRQSLKEYAPGSTVTVQCINGTKLMALGLERLGLCLAYMRDSRMSSTWLRIHGCDTSSPGGLLAFLGASEVMLEAKKAGPWTWEEQFEKLPKITRQGNEGVIPLDRNQTILIEPRTMSSSTYTVPEADARGYVRRSSSHDAFATKIVTLACVGSA